MFFQRTVEREMKTLFDQGVPREEAIVQLYRKGYARLFLSLALAEVLQMDPSQAKREVIRALSYEQ
jgi:hypothetical protein